MDFQNTLGPPDCCPLFWTDSCTLSLTYSHVPVLSQGFGGKFGVETDRVDKSAKGWSEKAEVELHASQTDHKKVRQ